MQDRPSDPQQDGWLTRREAAEHARVSVSTIDRAIRRGELQATRTDGLVRLRIRWVDAWLLGRTTLVAVAAAVLLFAVVATVMGHCRLLHLDSPRCLKDGVAYTDRPVHPQT